MLNRIFLREKRAGGVIVNPGCKNYCGFCGPVPRASKEKVDMYLQNVKKNLVDFKNQGIKNIEISGSDPIEYEEIASLVLKIRQMGFKEIHLSTHGRRLSDESFTKSLIKAGITNLRIPIYGSNSEIHGAITHSKESFNETIRGIKLVKKLAPQIHIQMSSLIMQRNKEDLTKIIDLIKSLKVDSAYISIPFVANKDYSYYIPLKELSPYVIKAYEYTKAINYSIRFCEIPFCVFGFYNSSITPFSLPPNLGKYCQPPKQHRTNIKDMPAYRLKKQVNMCNLCKARDICPGFPINDISKFGTGDLKPIVKEMS